MSQALVAQVKAQLQGEGKDLSGPCGAFAITSRVAWFLRATGAGLLDKPSGNNCQNFATDIIAYPDGRIRDILGDAGGANIPQWGDDSEVVDASRYRPAFDPGGGQPEPTPVPVPVPPPNQDAVLLKLEQVSNALVAQGMLIDKQNRLIADLIAKPSTTPAPVSFPKYTGSIFGYRVTLTPIP